MIRLSELYSSVKQPLAYLQRSTISSADLLEPSFPMVKSKVTENMPKQTEFERDQHKVVHASKAKALWALPGTDPFPGSAVIYFALLYQPVTSTCNTLWLRDTCVDCMPCITC